MENHHFQWVNQLYMAMFNSHVSLPKGSSCRLMMRPVVDLVAECSYPFFVSPVYILGYATTLRLNGL